ncbi:MAG: WD40 repeat domain-containing serine/threonine protein kinase [Gemmataceae bacterium]
MSNPSPSPVKKDGTGVAAGAGQTQTVIGRAEAPSKPGDKIPRDFGRYRIIDCLGRGGMGAVFKAHDNQLDRIVALKVPFIEDNDSETRQRFLREARTAATLQHANICPVFDADVFNGWPYITMAFIEGRSLAQARSAAQVFPPTQIAFLIRKVALAMQEAHNRGIIHRDLKPANILLKPNGEPIVMDFGLARRLDEQKSDGLTKQGDVIGTVDYMSPEQVEGDLRLIGPPTDIYALGVILYEMITGRRPFEGTTTSILAQILVKPAPRPSELKPDVPPKLEEVCLKAIAKTPADRYPTMNAFAAALAEYLRNPQQAATSAPRTNEAARATPPPSANTAPIKERVTPGAPGSGRKSTRPELDVRPSGVTKSGVKSGARSSKRAGTRRKKKEKSAVPVVIGVSLLVMLFVGAIVAAIVFWPRGNSSMALVTSPQTGMNNDFSSKYTPPNPNPNRPATSSPASPTTVKAKPKAGFAVSTPADNVKVAVGIPTKVKLKIDRQDYKGAVTIAWDAPQGVRVTPGSPVTIKPEQTEVELTLNVMSEAGANNTRLAITATPKDDPQRDKVASSIGVEVPTGGPCIRVVEIGNRPAGALESMAFTPDATLALIGGGSGKSGQGQDDKTLENNAIQVWNLEKGEAISSLSGHRDRVTSVSISADGRVALSVGADDTAATWDLAQGKLKKQTPKQAQHLLLAAMSADGKSGLLAFAGAVVQNQQIPAIIAKINLGTLEGFGTPLKSGVGSMLNSKDPEAVRALALSPDHKFGLIGGVNGKLVYIDLAKAESKPKHFAGHSEAVLCAVFSPIENFAATGGGGTLLAGKLQQGKDNAVRLWNLTSGTTDWSAEGHANSVVCLEFSPDGELLASGGADGEIRVWKVKDGSPVATLAGHSGKVLGLAFSKDGKQLWSGAADRTMRQWRLP